MREFITISTVSITLSKFHVACSPDSIRGGRSSQLVLFWTRTFALVIIFDLALPEERMGVGYSVYFTKEELEEYELVTCLTSADILDLYRKFKLLGGHRAKESAPAGDLERNGEKKAPLKALLSQKEFVYNPFARKHASAERAAA